MAKRVNKNRTDNTRKKKTLFAFPLIASDLNFE